MVSKENFSIINKQNVEFFRNTFLKFFDTDLKLDYEEENSEIKLKELDAIIDSSIKDLKILSDLKIDPAINEYYMPYKNGDICRVTVERVRILDHFREKTLKAMVKAYFNIFDIMSEDKTPITFEEFLNKHKTIPLTDHLDLKVECNENKSFTINIINTYNPNIVLSNYNYAPGEVFCVYEYYVLKEGIKWRE